MNRHYCCFPSKSAFKPRSRGGSEWTFITIKLLTKWARNEVPVNVRKIHSRDGTMLRGRSYLSLPLGNPTTARLS